MIQRRLLGELDKVARRFRRLRLFGALAMNWTIAALVGLLLIWMTVGAEHRSPWTAAWLAAAFVATAAAFAWGIARSCGDRRWLAHKIEAVHPALQSRLLTAVQQQPDSSTGRFSYLQETVMREALEHGRRYRWENTVSDGRIFSAQLAHFVSLTVFAGVLLTLVMIGAADRGSVVAAAAHDENLVEVGQYRVDVKPGDTDVERGTSLVVVARFEGQTPADATLLVKSAAGRLETLPMSRNLEDPLFGARVAAVSEELTYLVAFDRQQTRSYRVTVFEYPALIQADARLTFPGYTSLEEKFVEDTRRVTAVEGTKLTWLLRLNKAIARGRLESSDGEVLLLQLGGGEDHVYTATVTLQETRRYRLHLEDAQGRANREPPELVVNVVPNRPPEIEIAWPSRDAQVSPLEEFDLEAAAWDDFGLTRYGLIYSHAGGEPQEIVLGEGGGPKERREMVHQIDFEELQAEPDQLLSYYFFAEDCGPDGRPRRTWSDMFFAEVRPFEQVFRQGEQPPEGEQQQQQQQQSGQNAQQAEQLAELQKQIIAATWNIMRREMAQPTSSQFTPDVRLVVESQNAALQQLEQLSERVQDAQARAHVAEAKQHMVGALQQLMRAADETSSEPLREALPAEQGAYQALLKLRAREHQVMRSNARQQQQQSGGGAASAMQQQLNELELKQDENRYETQRTAQSQQEQQQQEVRQAVNRLRELARRQDDLNKQLQELQSSLEQAATEQEQEEIRRRLERLREEQQQILRDIDELRERMDQPQNQREMAAEQQQLTDARERVRQASEALEQGMVSQALAQGTRAQREFEELRDEFRRRAAGQFDEEMREMREAARQLEEDERALAERLQERNSAEGRRSLRDSSPQEEIARGLQEQREGLQDLLQRIEQVVQDAEQPEPLLADQLYDTLRRARQEPIDNALETARQLAQAGLLDQAAPAEEVARRGLENLRRGVERAAESVLGDETEALARAHETLGELTDDLQREAEIRGQANEERTQETRNESQEAGERESDSGSVKQPPDGRPQDEGASRDTQSRNPGERGGETLSTNEQASARSAAQSPDSQSRAQPSETSRGGQRGESQQERESQENPQARERSSSNQAGQQQSGQRSGRADSPDSENQQEQSRGGQASPSELRPRSLRGAQGGATPGGPQTFDTQGGPRNPLTGDDFREWSDQMRNVEEMLDDPELRAEAARIRDRARAMRVEFRRHSEEPNWELVQLQVIEPLHDLRNRIAEELMRRQAKDDLTPIDRDPVPPRFAAPLRRYYEELGRGDRQ